ncbi:MAG TPA: tetratricopeptide repeat protein [Flavisolibacter sp.]|jgi:tetratricopeptide (TPR) repeat protein|nr:tetratricopeptide repeat protein [Flavisolibacter sp.]
MNLIRHILFLTAGLFLFSLAALAQPGFQVDIDKPQPYQERKLKAEKTGDGKLKAPKRILQNLTTRFNYVFNANNKFNEIIERAQEQHRDDYAELLTFYPYTLEATAADSIQLDSVIYKARTGIVNHDLRNEWIDELYLLWAASFHLQKKFDSASMMLQFINYAYAPKFEDGYYKHIGTNTDGAKELSISTREEKKLLHSNTFSRNNSFLWQIRTLTEMEKMTAAGSLISTLRRDPVFPERLRNGLDEVEAYWYYRQQQWDSAAVHLLAAVDGDYSRKEKARWHYLAAQLMEKAGKPDEAATLYQKVVTMTPDPVMEVYARLNVVRLSKEGGDDAIDKNLAELLKMARRDKYEEYRDIIYYMAAQMELQRGNIDAASELLIKGSQANNGDQASRNKAFLKIADVSYQQKKYLQAASFYDSVQVAGLPDVDVSRVMERKTALQKVVLNSGVVYRQDSLQRIAALPEEQRNDYIKTLVKKLRKAQGLKEDATLTSGGSSLAGNTPPVDLFNNDAKGEWYFYNTAAKTKGSAQFKSVWGNRPNVDNWRRFAAVNQQILSHPDKPVDPVNPTAATAGNPLAPADLTVEGLLSRLPLSPEAVQTSNDSIRTALFGLGLAYLNEVEDYPSAIQTFEELRRRFPNADKMDEVLFNLHYAYSKLGDGNAAAQVKRLLESNYPSSRFTAIAATGIDPQAPNTDLPAATKAYENVYNLFIEGKFGEAQTAKRIADSTYRTKYWDPQLLYIEAVYYIKQRQDSVATGVLQTIVRQNNKGMSEKAQNLINVLARRQQIEDELTRLQITRPSDEEPVSSEPVVAAVPPVAKKDTVVAVPEVKPKIDSAVVKKPVTEPAVDSAALAKVRQKQVADSIAFSNLLAKRMRDSLETIRRDSIALAKKEAEQARKDSLAKKALADQLRRDSIATAKAAREQARRDSIDLAQALKKQASDSLALQKYLAKRERDSLDRVIRDSLALVKKRADEARRDSLARVALEVQQRKDSIALAEKQRKDALAQEAQRRKDSIALETQRKKDSIDLARTLREQARRDSIAQREAFLKRQRDSIEEARRNYVDPNAYHYEEGKPHFAIVIMDKVDPIFVNEARTAFHLYNREAYPNRSMDVQIVNLSADTRMLVISGLPTAAAATDYVTTAQPLAAKEIIPWLTANKYSFSIITERNLSLLRTKTNIEEYKRFLEQHLPGKF